MAITSKFLKDIEAEARPIIERQMNDAKIIAGLRDVVSAAGGDWGALKALIKARVEDDNDEAGEGKRVRKIREKADCIVAYDDMLDSNMNEKNFSASQSYAEAKGRGAGSSNGRTSEFDSENAGSNPAPVTSGELTDTQEQPEEPATQSDQSSAPAGVSEYAGTSPDENPAPHSPSPVTPPAQVIAGDDPQASSATPFNNPRCDQPDTCRYAHSEDSCHDCFLAWATRPRDERIRLWQEAMEAASETEAA